MGKIIDKVESNHRYMANGKGRMEGRGNGFDFGRGVSNRLYIQDVECEL